MQNTRVNISKKEKTMTQKDTVAAVWEQHKKVIPGGVVSLNRVIDPMRVFVKAEGAYLWDSDGDAVHRLSRRLLALSTRSQ